jgi:hypothetical protein
VIPPVVGVSLGHRELSEADHWILSLSPRPVLARTHLVSSPYRHVAISLNAAAGSAAAGSAAAGSAAGSPDGLRVPASAVTPAELSAAADAAAADQAGRAVLFPGWDALVGILTVEAVLASSAIDRVEVLGGGPASPSAEVDTRDFVRPIYRGGELVLVTTPAAGGRLVPFESPNPTPCCADHSR